MPTDEIDGYRLSDLDLDEISLCEVGVNQPSKVVLWKSDRKDGVEKAVKGSYEWKREIVSMAISDRIKAATGKDYVYPWVRATFGDSVVYDHDGKTYQVDYEFEDGKVTLGEAKEVTLAEVIVEKSEKADISKCGGMSDHKKLKKGEKCEDCGYIKKSVTNTDTSSTNTVDNESNPGGTMPEGTINKDELPQEVVEYISSLEDELSEAVSLLEEVGKSADGDDEGDDDVMKSLPPQVQEMIAKSQREAEEARELAKAEREARLVREFTDIAKSMTLPAIETDKLATVLKSASEKLSTEEYDAFKATLDAASAAFVQSNVFKEIGKSTTAPDSPEAKLESLAKSETENTADPNARLIALAKAAENNPELYAELRNGGK